MKLPVNIIAKILLGLLLLISAGTIFYQFPAIPQNLSFDEVEFGRLALSLENKTYTAYSEMATGHATMYFYILLASLKTFGINSFALRFPSAVFGVLNALLIFLVTKNIFTTSKKEDNAHWILPYFITFIFVTLRWHINFARFSFEATLLLCLELLSLLFFIYFRNTKSSKYLILCGVFAGLAYNSYTPGRLFFIVPLIFIALEQGWKNLLNKKILLNIALYIIPFVLMILPLSLYLSQHQDIRISQLSYMNDTKLTTADKTSYLSQNLLKNASMFFAQGDLNGRHNYPGKPIINPILGILLIVGIVAAIRKGGFYTRLFLLYALIALIPTLLTYPQENPNSLRAFTLIPAFIYFIGCALQTILDLKLKKELLICGIMLLILGSSVYELRTYFLYQTQVFPHAFEMKGDLPKLMKLNEQLEKGYLE